MLEPTLNVLIVDDEPGDRMLEKLALAELDFSCTMRSALRTDEAIGHLEHWAAMEGSGLDVILLDGHLQKRRATDIIDYVKGHARLKDIHVVVLSGSITRAEHNLFLRHGADAVLEKSADFNELVQTLATLKRYARAA